MNHKTNKSIKINLADLSDDDDFQDSDTKKLVFKKSTSTTVINDDNETKIKFTKVIDLKLSEKTSFPTKFYDHSSPASLKKGKRRASVRESCASEMNIELRNTRKAYECEELGENQAFLDDIEYLFDGLSSSYKLSDRCLCAIKLAESCLSSEFRMNLRLSYEYINRIFKSLNDSVNYQVKSIHSYLTNLHASSHRTNLHALSFLFI